MKFMISNNELVKALRNVKTVVKDNTDTPVLSDYKFNVMKGSLEIIGSNVNLTINTHVEVNDQNTLAIVETGQFLVNSNLFSKIINKMTGTITIKSFDDQIVIKTKSSKFKLATKDVEEYPALPELSGQHIQIESQQLAELAHHTAFSASKDNNRPILQGILLTVKDNMIKAIATDAHRFSQHVIKAEHPFLSNDHADGSLSSVLPATDLKKVIAAMNTQDNEENPIDMYFTDNMVIFRDANITMYLVKLAGNYPSIEMVINAINEQSYTSKLLINTKEFLNTLQRGRLIAHNSSNTVDMFLSPDTVTIVQNDKNSIGTFNEDINNAQYTGKAMQVSFNPDFVIDELQHCGLNTVEMEFNDNQSANDGNGYNVRPFLMFQRRMNLLNSTNMANANFQMTTPVRKL
ncbi:DNA polymerase III subunit beta [Apilactobacillus timberlakei]|uniref:DNA polymerase III subunit beta n=1 Tax=Apilactobacillus timberlakei TaxID=2008380 RepID=UPI001128491B|nr:DNA polymerase III subunit beta [Apilactobacillus timberlakei]TPR13024.1 DNA polymerase III subunit beta [Apilactobacillus timberlakei]